MKISYKKATIWVIVAVFLAIIFIQPSTQRDKFVYEIETISQTCSFDDFPEQEIKTLGRSIVITVPVQTPTQCYRAEGTVTSFGNDIAVNLNTKQTSDVCVDCVGTVVAKVTISSLDRGEYNLQINTPDKVLIRELEIE